MVPCAKEIYKKMPRVICCRLSCVLCPPTAGTIKVYQRHRGKKEGEKELVASHTHRDSCVVLDSNYMTTKKTVGLFISSLDFSGSIDLQLESSGKRGQRMGKKTPKS
jgi:hypothetical protein